MVIPVDRDLEVRGKSRYFLHTNLLVAKVFIENLTEEIKSEVSLVNCILCRKKYF